jgi:hypothetical protein
VRGDPAVAEIAARQERVVSIAQLRGAGLGRGAVEHRVRRQRLFRVHRGVYAVGPGALTFRGHLWAAALATGGVVSHRSAAAVWDLLPVPSGKVDITTLRTGNSTAAIRIHRRRDVESVVLDGLHVTTVARTIFDMAPQLSAHRVERLCHRAEVLRLLDARALHALLDAHPRRDLEAALASLAVTGPQLTRSTLEERFLELVVHAGLPRPLVNAVIAGFEVDFFWPQLRLVVETDGAAAHLTPTAFEADRRRDAALQAAGVKVLRFTHRWIAEDAGNVIATLRQVAC